MPPAPPSAVRSHTTRSRLSTYSKDGKGSTQGGVAILVVQNVPAARDELRDDQLLHRRARISPPPGYRRSAGQSTVEFALLVPVMFLLVLAIADFGRLYTSAVAVEAAAREAADFGSFNASNWTSSPSPGNYATTVAEMERRACTAAAGSHLEGYKTTDPVNNATCTNPTFACTLERNGASADCLGSAGFTNGVDCSDPSTEPPCTVHVSLTYQFQTFFLIPPLPSSIAVVRDSYFRISNLQPAPSPTP